MLSIIIAMNGLVPGVKYALSKKEDWVEGGWGIVISADYRLSTTLSLNNRIEGSIWNNYLLYKDLTKT